MKHLFLVLFWLAGTRALYAQPTAIHTQLMSSLHTGDSLYTHGRSIEALNLVLKTKQDILDQFGKKDTLYVHALTLEAWCLLDQCHYTNARDRAMEAYCIRLNQGAQKSMEMANLHLFFGEYCRMHHLADSADYYYGRAREMLAGTAQEHSFQMAYILTFKGYNKCALLQIEEGEKLIRQGLAIALPLVRTDSIRLAPIYRCLVLVESEQGKEAAYQSTMRYVALLDAHLEKDHPWRAKGFQCLASLAQHNMEYSAAEEYYNQALDITIRYYGANNLREGNIYQDLGTLKFLHFEPQQGVAFYLKNLQIVEAAFGANSIDYGIACSDMASTLDRQGKWEDARFYYEKSLQVLQQIPSADARIWQIFVLRDYADWHINKNLYTEAVVLLARAEALFTDAVSRRVKRSIWNTMALSYLSLHRIVEAKYYALAVTESSNTDEPLDLRMQAENNFVLGYVYSQENNKSKAVAHLRRCVEQSKASGYWRSNYYDTSCSFLGYLYGESGPADSAQYFLLEALSVARLIYNDPSPPIARAYNALGYFCQAQKRYPEAVSYMQLSADQYERFGPEINTDKAGAYLAIANIYQLSAIELSATSDTTAYFRQFDSVQFNLNLALKSLGYPGSTLRTGKDGLMQLQSILYVLGQSHYLKYQHDHNIQDLIKAKGALDSAYARLNNFPDPVVRLEGETAALTNRFINPLGIQVNELLGNVTRDSLSGYKAFCFAEKMMSPRLRAAFFEQNAQLTGLNPPEYYNAERRLQVEMSNLSELISFGNKNKLNNDSLNVLIRQYIKSSREFDSLLLVMKRDPDAARYAKAKFDDTPPSVVELQQALEADQVFVEYTVAGNSVYAFVFSRETFQAVRLSADFEAVKRDIDQLWNGITGFYSLPDLQQSDMVFIQTARWYNHAAYAIYQNLVEPIEPLLKPRIVVARSGYLGRIPFDLLLASPAPDEKSFSKSNNYLVGKYAISYTYSAKLWLEMAQKRPLRHSGNIGVFAPEFPHETAGADAPIFPFLDTRAQGEAVLKALWNNGTLLHGPEASIKNVCSGAGNFDILHLPTHAGVHPTDGDSCYLVLSDGRKTLGYEKFYVKKIYTIDLPCSLISTTACFSNYGPVDPQEGILSFTRACSYAGANSVVSSSWLSNENSAGEITKLFYQYLVQHQSKDVALAKAKRRYLRENAHNHPFFWGGIVLWGNTAPLFEKK